MSKSIRLIAHVLFALALAPVVLSLAPGRALAQAAPWSLLTCWVDRSHKTIVFAAPSPFDPTKCIAVPPYTILSLASSPKHGEVFIDIEQAPAPYGMCPGVTFPAYVVRYRWTDPKEEVLQDSFTILETSSEGPTWDTDITVQLAKIVQDRSIWWACGVTRPALPNTATLTLENPPPLMIAFIPTTFVWTITSGGAVFSNDTPTITTSTNTAEIESRAASPRTSYKDVNIEVSVPGTAYDMQTWNWDLSLSYSYQTNVRTPKKLTPRPERNKNFGVAVSCQYPPKLGTQGWLSTIWYEVDDQYGVNTSFPDGADAGINEQFGAQQNAPGNKANNWPPLSEGGSGTPDGLFFDNICVTGSGLTPQPQTPQTPLTKNEVDFAAQAWFAGDSTKPATHKGCKVQTDTIVRYIDHGLHANVQSPPRGVSPGAQATAAAGVTAFPIHALNVRRLAGQATVIVKGRVLKVNEVGTIKEPTESGALTFREMIASFQVDRVLKGKVEGGVIDVEFLKNPEVLALSLEENEYALLFLTSGREGRYAFVDPQVSKMPITSQNVPSADASETTADKLEAELFASFSDPDREVARTALEQVGDLRKVRSTQALRDIAASGDSEFQGLAHAALLRLGDYSLLEQAIGFAEQPAQDLEMWRRQMGVAQAISEIQDRSVVPVLDSLLGSPTVSLRRAAAKALRTISDPSSAPFLVRALDDSDREVQYNAVMGLADIVGPAPDNAPAQDVFEESPAKYLGYWKDWWETSGKQRYEPSR